MSLIPLNAADLVQLQSIQYAAQAAQDPSQIAQIRDDASEPIADIWFATSQVAIELDANNVYVSSKSRYQTSVGADLDSALSIFGVNRVPAQPAVGTIVVTPNSAPPQDVYILLGALCQTASGLQFQAIADTSQGAYVAGAGYRLPAGSSAPISVTVSCLTSGSAGNVAANTITSLVAGLGVTSFGSVSITNPAAFTTGSVGESDLAYLTRFQNVFISGRSATALAILAAIASAATGTTFQLNENYNGSTQQYGFFTAYVGLLGSSSGPGAATLASVTSAIAAAKAEGIGFSVVAPTLSPVSSAGTITVSPAYTVSSVTAAANAAFIAYANSIGLSPTFGPTTLYYAQACQVILAVPGVMTLSNLTLNGAYGDVSAPGGTQIVAGTANFHV